MRLDKYLAEMSVGTRSEVKKIIKTGRVFVNDIAAEKPECKVNPGIDMICVDGQAIEYFKYKYYMLNKPQGVVSATTDREHPTVISLITQSKRRDLFPVGRLDIDTEGLLLITNDGDLSHRLLSPKKHVDKTYLVRTKGIVNADDVRILEQGVDIGDEKPTLPARVCNLIVLEEGQTELELTIQEGRYHQVKRMLEHVGKPVIYLKRISMGPLRLDPDLPIGESRSLTSEEIAQLQFKG